MKAIVWGCRGSLPSPGPEKIRYGGNTSCVQVVHNNTNLVLDAGSGIQRLGLSLDKQMKETHILLTHLHIDHTMGLGFFLPLYNPATTVHIYGPATGEETLISRIRRYFSPPLFPVRLNELPVHPVIHEIGESEFTIGDLKIQSAYICHPGPTLGYRVSNGSAVMCYMPDHEIALGSSNFPNEPEWTSGYKIAEGAGLLFHDAQYRPAEYKQRAGWGHSSIEDTIEYAGLCGVKRLSLFHHDPLYSDDQLNKLFDDFTKDRTFNFSIDMCAEGNVYEVV
jgi:phosphoribosyl 1,2-cyclic phosphodiesterase